MARRYLEVGEIIPPGTWYKGEFSGDFPSEEVGRLLKGYQVGRYYVEVPDTLPPEVIALMTEIKSHLTSAQQLMQTLETRLNTPALALTENQYDNKA